MALKQHELESPKPKTGGYLAGSGKPKGYLHVPDEVREFRDYWRTRMLSPAWRKKIEAQAKTSIPLLIELMRHAFGQPPQSIDVSVNEQQQARVVTLADGRRLSDVTTVEAVPVAGTSQQCD